MTPPIPGKAKQVPLILQCYSAMVNTGTIAAVKVMYVLLCGVVDCGIGSRVGHEEIVWAKRKPLAAGARLASKEIWG